MNELKHVIAVVDDEAIIRKSLEIILTKNGFEVIAAKNGEILLERVKDKPAHVYIIDLDLPGINGVDLSIKILDQQPDAKIILLSGFSIDEYEPLATMKNFVSSLLKPVDINILLETIQSALSPRSTHDQESGSW